MRNILSKIGLVSVLAVPGLAFADPATFDLTDITGTITNAQTGVATIGAAVIVTFVIVAGFRYLKRAL